MFTNLYVYKSKYNIEENSFELKIMSYKIDGNKLSVNLSGKENLVGTYYFKTIEEKQDFYSKYSIGDYIVVNGELDEPKNNTIPNTFNYKKYLYNNKIFFILKIYDFKTIKNNNNIFYKIKNTVYKRIEKIIYNEYIYALVLGDIYYVDDEVNKSFNYNGISHIFALSGSHVTLLAAFSLYVIKIIRKMKGKSLKEERFIDYIIISILLFAFAFITGFKPSFMKSVFLFIFIGINKVYYFNIRTDNLLILSYILLLIINPFYLYDVGFQLSLTITYFLLFSSNHIKTKGYFKNLILSGIISLFSSIPILINSFYSINLLSLINNLFFIPFISFVVYPISIIVFIFPSLNKLLYFITNILENISLKLSYIKLLSINFPKMNIFFIILFYLGLILLIIKNNKIKYFIMILILLIFLKYKNIFNNETNLYFLDVGQGDSTLIITPNKKTILVDTGGYLKYEVENWEIKNREFNLMKSSIIPFFKSVGINKIDYLFLSHADEDHAGYSLDLVNNFNVKNIIINKGEISNIESLLDFKRIQKYYEIDNIKIYSLNDFEYDNENDNSLILLFIIEDKKILFMGDASVEQEKYVIDKYNLDDIYILKVGHHGSKTSTCEEFVNYTNPIYSVISVGVNNKFGHPNKDVLLRLKTSKIYRTDEYGTVTFNIY